VTAIDAGRRRSLAGVSLRLAAAALAALVGLSGCGGDTTGPPPPRGGSSVTLRLVSPNGPEGAAVLELDAAPVQDVSGDSDRVYFARVGQRLRVVLLSARPGELRAVVTVSDPGAALHPTVLQVADSLNQLRPDVSGYAVKVVR